MDTRMRLAGLVVLVGALGCSLPVTYIPAGPQHNVTVDSCEVDDDASVTASGSIEGPDVRHVRFHLEVWRGEEVGVATIVRSGIDSPSVWAVTKSVEGDGGSARCIVKQVEVSD